MPAVAALGLPFPVSFLLTGVCGPGLLAFRVGPRGSVSSVVSAGVTNHSAVVTWDLLVPHGVLRRMVDASCLSV